MIKHIPSLILFLFVFGHLQIQPDTTAQIRLDKINNELGLVFVEGGTFQMGDAFYEGRSNEFPVHEVKVNDFYISKYETNQKLWNDTMGFPSRKSQLVDPVQNVSWYDIIYFCNKLSEKNDLKKAYTVDGEKVECDFSADGFRLPTEAEWEYASRGGKYSRGYRYSGSDDVDSVAWTGNDRMNSAQTLGAKKANELGIYDMSGNIAEWVWDYYDKHYYKSSPENNPTGPEIGRQRILRGGSWYMSNAYARNTARIEDFPTTAIFHYGFRVARSANK